MLLPDIQLKTLLLQSGLLTQQKIAQLEGYAADARSSLQDAVIEKDAVADDKLGLLIANYLKVPFVTLSKMTIPEGVFRIVPERLARKYKVIAFARDNDGIKLAMADPTDQNIQAMIVKKTWQKVSVYLATERDIDSTLQLYQKNLQQT